MNFLVIFCVSKLHRYLLFCSLFDARLCRSVQGGTQDLLGNISSLQVVARIREVGVTFPLIYKS